MTEHAVIIAFRYGSTNLDRLFELEEQLELALSEAGVGEYDGNEIAVDGSDGTLFMYGPDADRLLQVIEPVVRPCPFMKGAHVRRRYGGPDSDHELESTIE